MTFRRGFPTEANRIAIRIREKMELAPCDPIDPAAICEIYDIELLPLSELDECETAEFLTEGNKTFSAVTVPRGHRTAIVHNDSHHPYRQRSNICHELGHCFLGHETRPPLNSKGERIRDGSIEGEANYLAGTLLLTNEGALNILRKGLIPVAQKMYGISKPMLTYRLRISGAQKRYNREN